MLFINSPPPTTPATVAAEKRAAAAGRLRRAIGLAVWRLVVLSLLSLALTLLQHLSGVPCRAAAGFRRAHARHRTARLVLPEYRVAHRIQESAGLALFGSAAFQFLDAIMGALQRFVLNQCRLHQRIDGVRRTPQALRNSRGGVGIARRGLYLRKPIEKLINQLTFLRCHDDLHCARLPSAGEM
jgi:hypothetical protein